MDEFSIRDKLSKDLQKDENNTAVILAWEKMGNLPDDNFVLKNIIYQESEYNDGGKDGWEAVVNSQVPVRSKMFYCFITRPDGGMSLNILKPKD